MAEDPQEPGLWSARHRRLTVGLVLSITLVAFETLAVSTVMPIVTRDLGGLELYGWVFSAFFLSSLVGIVVLGGLVDRFGPAPPFAIGMGIFGIGLLIGGLAPSMEVLVAARVLQGFGGGAIAPTSYAAIGRRLPEPLRPAMFAVLASAWVIPGLIGPAVAGAVGDQFGWRVVFLGLLPLVGVSAILVMPSLHAIGPPSVAEDGGAAGARPAEAARRLPFAILVALGAGLILGGLSADSLVVLALLTGGGLLLALPAYVRLVPAGTLTARFGLPAAVLVRALTTFSFFSVYAYIPFALVEVRGLTLSEAGLALTAGTVAWTGGAWVAARLVEPLGEGRLVRIGLIVMVTGLVASLAILAPVVPAHLSIVTFGIAGLGIGISYSPVSLIVLALAPKREIGTATSGLQLSDVLGESLGTGVTGAILAAAVRTANPTGPPLALAFGIGVLVGAVALLLTVRLPARSVVSTPAAIDVRRAA